MCVGVCVGGGVDGKVVGMAVVAVVVRNGMEAVACVDLVAGGVGRWWQWEGGEAAAVVMWRWWVAMVAVRGKEVAGRMGGWETVVGGERCGCVCGW